MATDNGSSKKIEQLTYAATGATQQKSAARYRRPRKKNGPNNMMGSTISISSCPCAAAAATWAATITFRVGTKIRAHGVYRRWYRVLQAIEANMTEPPI